VKYQAKREKTTKKVLKVNRSKLDIKRKQRSSDEQRQTGDGEQGKHWSMGNVLAAERRRGRARRLVNVK